jgi:hypothetical protein
MGVETCARLLATEEGWRIKGHEVADNHDRSELAIRAANW